MKLLLASGNKNKLKEMSALLAPLGVEIVSPEMVNLSSFDVVEDGASFEENAMLKARAYSREAGLPAIADDSGLCVDALGGAPGIFSARYGDEGLDDKGRTALLLRNMAHVETDDRGAHFVSAIAFAGTDTEFVVRGECEGIIAKEPRGDGGFGYDPVFVYPPHGKTFSELTTEKNEISHRAVAMKKFLEKIREMI